MLDSFLFVGYYGFSDRVADACGACNLGRNLRGSPHFTNEWEWQFNGKSFLNYGQQINMLVNDKKLNIPNPEYALEMLKRYSYYSLISGYKNEFKDPATAQYRPDVCFGDIVALYEFDENLRTFPDNWKMITRYRKK
ncbi:MAG: Abi family protein [Clostridiales bacterium]|nr:Abi family protein [Clostridiales bacterium]